MRKVPGHSFVIQLQNESAGCIVIFLAQELPRDGTTSHTKGNFIKQVASVFPLRM